MEADKSSKSDFTSAIIGNAEKYSLGKQENLCTRNAREYFFPTYIKHFYFYLSVYANVAIHHKYLNI